MSNGGATGAAGGVATSAPSQTGGSPATGGTSAPPSTSAAGGNTGTAQTTRTPQASGSSGGCDVAGGNRGATRWGAMAALGAVLAAKLRRLVSDDDKSS
jgi:hypothetical protein